MISRCCCPLWLNIQTKSVCVCVCKSVCVCALFWRWSFLPVCLSLPPAVFPKCTASCGLTGEAQQHDAHSSLQGPTSRRVHIFFFFFFQCFVLVLKRLRGSGQLGHFHVDHDAGGAECDGAEGCLLVSHVSLSVINTSWVM